MRAARRGDKDAGGSSSEAGSPAAPDGMFFDRANLSTGSGSKHTIKQMLHET